MATVGTIVLLTIFVAMPPANAANPEIGNGVCNTTNYCAYQLASKGGSVADFRACEPDWYCGIFDLAQWDYFNTNTEIDNRTSEIWNRGTAYPWSVWTQHPGGGGMMICFASGVYANQATLAALDMDNRISSMWTSTTNDCTL